MDLTTLLFPLLILVLFVPIFLSGRRQKRQMTEMQNLQSSLHPGDVVMTTSGLRGTVVDASYEETVDIEIADGVVTTWIRAAIREKVALPGDEVAEATPEVVDGDVAPAGTDATSTATTSTASTSTASTADPVTDVKPAGAPSLQKDDSTNGTARG
jgi:preprotein translocase subunit YajC